MESDDFIHSLYIFIFLKYKLKSFQMLSESFSIRKNRSEKFSVKMKKLAEKFSAETFRS